MTTTPTSQPQDRDAPVWTGDAVDYDAWFDTPWGHHAFTVESAAVRRACGDLAGRSELQALGTPHGGTSLHGALYAPGVLPGLSRIGPLLETAGRAAPGWGAFQVLAIDKDRHP
jgi:hypothetical protein